MLMYRLHILTFFILIIGKGFLIKILYNFELLDSRYILYLEIGKICFLYSSDTLLKKII